MHLTGHVASNTMTECAFTHGAAFLGVSLSKDQLSVVSAAHLARNGLLHEREIKCNY